jgi:hypothetical protein
MIITFFFLITVLTFFAGAYIATRKGMEGVWAKQGPAQVVKGVRARNRTVLIIALAFLLVVAVLEAFIIELHDMMIELQYAAGDLIRSEPALYVTTAFGGISWGLYMSILLGVAIGMVGGTYMCCRQYSIMSAAKVYQYA